MVASNVPNVQNAQYVLVAPKAPRHEIKSLFLMRIFSAIFIGEITC